MVLSLFEHFVEKSGETVFQKLLLSITFFVSTKLLKYDFIAVLSRSFTKSLLLVVF